jgi:hypothetical protein
VKIVNDEDGRLASIELDRVEMRELLAFEATCACLVPRTRHAFLEATMREYRIPAETMLPLLAKKVLAREDVWTLQTLKREATGDQAALAAIGKLRHTETALGRDVLHLYVDRKRVASDR